MRLLLTTSLLLATLGAGAQTIGQNKTPEQAGTYTLQVRARDAAGNRQAKAAKRILRVH